MFLLYLLTFFFVLFLVDFSIASVIVFILLSIIFFPLMIIFFPIFILYLLLVIALVYYNKGWKAKVIIIKRKH